MTVKKNEDFDNRFCRFCVLDVTPLYIFKFRENGFSFSLTMNLDVVESLQITDFLSSVKDILLEIRWFPWNLNSWPPPWKFHILPFKLSWGSGCSCPVVVSNILQVSFKSDFGIDRQDFRNSFIQQENDYIDSWSGKYKAVCIIMYLKSKTLTTKSAQLLCDIYV